MSEHEDPLIDVIRALEHYARGENDPAVAQAALAKFMPYFPCRLASNDHGLEADEQHVDDFIDDAYPTKSMNERYAKFVIFQFRLSAHLQYQFEPFINDHPLFATYEGKRYRVVGASRMGDVWLTDNLDSDQYTKRVHIKLLTEFCDAATYYDMSPPTVAKDPEPVIINTHVLNKDHRYNIRDLNDMRRILYLYHHSFTPMRVRSVDVQNHTKSKSLLVDFVGQRKFFDRYFVMENTLNNKVFAFGHYSLLGEIHMFVGEPTPEFLDTLVEGKRVGAFL